jgi:hypothetical protein
MRKAVLIVAAIVLGCSTPSTVAPLSVPLSYKTMATAAEFPTVAPCAAVSDVRVVDNRSEKSIGKRSVEGKSAQAATVTTTSDVSAWARTGALEALRRSGVTTSKAGAPVLRISIDDINTIENVLHRSGYEGHMTITAALVNASGRTCWQESFNSSAENYGYAGSVENYQETLNHALDRAMIRVLSSSGFKTAVCSC